MAYRLADVVRHELAGAEAEVGEVGGDVLDVAEGPSVAEVMPGVMQRDGFRKAVSAGEENLREGHRRRARA